MSSSLVPPFPSDVSLFSDDLNKHVPGYSIPLSESLHFLEKELSVEKLSNIYPHLWFAGRPKNYKALHRQAILRRNIVLTEDAGLHLVWYDNVMHIKPLPKCLMHYKFFESHICCLGNKNIKHLATTSNIYAPVTYHQRALYQMACGLLYSYTKLVQHESDYRLAVSTGLLPDIGWQVWGPFAQIVQARVESPGFILEKRYHYGELRLSRLNIIYKLTLRGYSYRYMFTEYGTYFTRNFQIFVFVFAYMTVMLAAMQVLLASDLTSKPLTHVSYWFSIVTMAVVVAIACVIFVLFVGLFIYHSFATFFFLWRARNEKLKEANKEVRSAGY